MRKNPARLFQRTSSVTTETIKFSEPPIRLEHITHYISSEYIDYKRSSFFLLAVFAIRAQRVARKLRMRTNSGCREEYTTSCERTEKGKGPNRMWKCNRNRLMSISAWRRENVEYYIAIVPRRPDKEDRHPRYARRSNSKRS